MKQYIYSSFYAFYTIKLNAHSKYSLFYNQNISKTSTVVYVPMPPLIAYLPMQFKINGPIHISWSSKLNPLKNP